MNLQLSLVNIIFQLNEQNTFESKRYWIDNIKFIIIWLYNSFDSK